MTDDLRSKHILGIKTATILQGSVTTLLLTVFLEDQQPFRTLLVSSEFIRYPAGPINKFYNRVVCHIGHIRLSQRFHRRDGGQIANLYVKSVFLMLWHLVSSWTLKFRSGSNHAKKLRFRQDLTRASCLSG
jgi:hypothetical protein